MRVFKLPKRELGLGLGSVAGDDLGYRPLAVVGDQHVLVENLLFEGGAGGLVDVLGKAQVVGFVSG